MALKDRIREARQNNSLTQEQLATKLGIAKSTLAGYETGNREPGIGMVAKIMHVLDVDANYLWQDETDFPIQVSYDEMQHIKKYRALDSRGKEIVDFLLNKEYERSIHEYEDDTMRKARIFREAHAIGLFGDKTPIVAEPELEYQADAAHSRTDIDIDDSIDTSEDHIMDDKDF